MKKKLFLSLIASALYCYSVVFCMEENGLSAVSKTLEEINERFEALNFMDKGDLANTYKEVINGFSKEFEKIQKEFNDIKDPFALINYVDFSRVENGLLEVRIKAEIQEAIDALKIEIEKRQNLRVNDKNKAMAKRNILEPNLENKDTNNESIKKLRKEVKKLIAEVLSDDDIEYALKTLKEVNDIETLKNMKSDWQTQVKDKKKNELKSTIKMMTQELYEPNEKNEMFEELDKTNDVDEPQKTKSAYENKLNLKSTLWVLIGKEYDNWKNNALFWKCTMDVLSRTEDIKELEDMIDKFNNMLGNNRFNFLTDTEKLKEEIWKLIGKVYKWRLSGEDSENFIKTLKKENNIENLQKMKIDWEKKNDPQYIEEVEKLQKEINALYGEKFCSSEQDRKEFLELLQKEKGLPQLKGIKIQFERMFGY